MLNMSSAADATPIAEDDRTARARIRDAAIARFADDGVNGTSLKAIAEDAVVSPALVVHHFGSKAGLRRECDRYVAATIREQKRAAMAQGPGFDPLTALRQSQDGPPTTRYLARTIGDGTPEVTALVDEMVDDGVAYMEEGVRSGVLKPTADPHGRATVLVLWSLGLLALHEHAERLLGVDLTSQGGDITPYLLPAAEIMGRGVLAEGMYERLVAALADQHSDKEPR